MIRRKKKQDLNEQKKETFPLTVQQYNNFTILDAKKHVLDSDQRFYIFAVQNEKIITSRPRHTQIIDDIRNLINDEINCYEESDNWFSSLKFAIIPAITVKEARKKFKDRNKIDVRLTGTDYRDRHRIRELGLKPYYEEGKYIGWRGKINPERWDEAAKFGSLTPDLEYTKQEYLKSIDSKRFKEAREIIKQSDIRAEEAAKAYVASKRMENDSL